MERLLGQNEPEEQGEHCTEAEEGLYDPGSHGKQDDNELPPGEGLNVPASQLMQERDVPPIEGLYVPATQRVQLVWPRPL